MKRLRFAYDCKRIAKVALDNGWECSLLHAEKLWEDVSEDVAASWLSLPQSDDELWIMMHPYMRETY